ncbi:MAG: tetratricopeptide repeat protein [Treponema sp.]|nr:tetratricopeptide repeat protein [Treponema sp.]
MADYSQALRLDPNYARAYNNLEDVWRARSW